MNLKQPFYYQTCTCCNLSISIENFITFFDYNLDKKYFGCTLCDKETNYVSNNPGKYIEYHEYKKSYPIHNSNGSLICYGRIEYTICIECYVNEKYKNMKI